jgi:hypothetical protein
LVGLENDKMQFDWQIIVVIPCVIWAAWAVFRQFFPANGQSKLGCGSGCGSCSSNPTNPKKGLVQLDLVPADRDRK